MNSLVLTEKQQEVIWLRFDRHASIDQIAQWLRISRRAVLMRLRNARFRTQRAGLAFPNPRSFKKDPEKVRRYSASQIAGGQLPLDEV